MKEEYLSINGISANCQIYLENLLIKKLNIKYQIETAREELINTNINIHMLSEIYIKSEISKDILPVFCKGIDKHILSFVVGK
jgi:hypothetical protein